MIIGLTGMTGAGKTTAAEILKEMGCHVINADEVGHSVTARPEVAERLREAFGEGCLNPDGSVNRRALGRLVFADGEKLRRLNEITHPLIVGEIAAEAASHSGETVVIDAALLKESGLSEICDAVWCVSADDEVRLERITKRDGLSREEALGRMRSQSPYGGDCLVIDNSSSKESLKEKIAEALCRGR